MAGITAVPGIRVGHATDREARTGCTVVLGPFRAACDVRGLATGTREIEALSPLHLVPRADAILLTGGSAFGLAAADGVMTWLEERGQGFDTGAARVPIVPAAVIYDLAVGRADRRPDAAMGRAACDAAASGEVAEGQVGAGTGATVGKLRGMAHAMPGGVGTWALTGEGYTVGALVVVNAAGDVVDDEGRIIAGARADDGGFYDAARALARGGLDPATLERLGANGPGTNTTLAVVATDAPLSRTGLETLARAAATGMARRIVPVHTPFDGDVTFAVSTAPEAVDLPSSVLLVLGILGAEALARAIERAVTVGR
ncbi:MAG: P1 family peptidase [bacterium]|mgnify:FL=1|jgi:L-aminopeptidase/D-esterase-like protein|nr:MAG: peptidase S58 [bacterium]